MNQDFDITGFVNFPNTPTDSGGTEVYLVAFSVPHVGETTLKKRGNFVGDDMLIIKPFMANRFNILESYVDHIKSDNIDGKKKFYFPNEKSSIKFHSSILLGWSKFSYEGSTYPWICSFRDLTNEGRKLYYSIKKLHNECEVRILTFKNI